MDKHDVSVVMISWSPTQSRLNVLKRSMESLLKCTTSPYELIVVDNGPSCQTEYLKSCKIDNYINPGLNVGVGRARNLGAAATDSPYIAFVDSDLEYFDGWLDKCVSILKKMDRWPLIATPHKSNPMKRRSCCVGALGKYLLFNRCGGGCVVIRRMDFERIGPWAEHSTPGGNYCDRARDLRYAYIWSPDWKVRHLCKHSSYNYKKILVNGQWIIRTKEI